MSNSVEEQLTVLDGFFASSKPHDETVHTSMNGFLASVEKRAYVIAMSACKDEQVALDIVQDTMLSMVKHYAKKNPQQWPPLFFKILNNNITDRHRRRGFGRLTQWFGERRDSRGEDESSPEAVDQLASDTFSPETLANSQDLQLAVKAALEHLSVKQQQALILRLWEGLSVKETATAMGISEGSVKTHLSRAIQEMRQHLQEHRQP